MSFLKIAVLLATTTATVAFNQAEAADDEVVLLQAQVEQKRINHASVPVDELGESDYGSDDPSKCTTQESVRGESEASFIELVVPHVTPKAAAALQSSTAAMSEDPAGAAMFRSVLLLGAVLLLLDCVRGWYVKAQRASKQSDVAQKRQVAEATAKTAWEKMVNAIRNEDVHLFNFTLAAALLELNSQDTLLKRADAWGCTALHFAAASASTQITKDLLKRGVAVDALDAMDETPLHSAVRVGNTATCELLIAAGANVNAVNKDGMTPLVVAGQAGHAQTCRLLADSDAGVAGMADEDLPALVVNQLVRKVVGA